MRLCSCVPEESGREARPSVPGDTDDVVAARAETLLAFLLPIRLHTDVAMGTGKLDGLIFRLFHIKYLLMIILHDAAGTPGRRYPAGS
jgi:hypothetical protein